MNTGVIYGSVTVSSAAMARSAYLHQVALLAPPSLDAREEELAELAAFCTGQIQDRYAWWRAPAWAGKSALMAWFVLHPPPGIRVVSFFITARSAAQNSRTAFVQAVLEQLAELLEQPVLAYDSTSEIHLRGMLTEAAGMCRDRGERLVLVVDGLDEDRGVDFSPDAHSIAALLPTEPPAGMRVVVTGRPNPPIPSDVPDDHPLRNSRIVRVLRQSARARVVRQDAERELRALLHGSGLERDVLGLVVAAAGGLSVADLAELTGADPWQIEEQLSTAAGRTFMRRPGRWRLDGGPQAYLLAHEELQNIALRFLTGSRLVNYQRRLHKWAEEYRQRQWPENTPDYLLGDYYQALQAAGDLDGMLALCTDVARHDRILDRAGGDADALAEVTAAQDVILSQPQPDLATIAMLAAYRDYHIMRATKIPGELPEVWAVLGDFSRAEYLARSLAKPSWQVQALTGIASKAAAAGDHERARGLIAQAKAAAESLADYDRFPVLAEVAQVIVALGDLKAAGELANSIARAGYETDGDPVLVAMAQAYADADDRDRALALVQDVIKRISSISWKNDALQRVMYVLARTGEPGIVESLLRSDDWMLKKLNLFAAWALANAKIGDYAAAERIIYSIDLAHYIHEEGSVETLLDAAAEMVVSGEFGRARTLLVQLHGLARKISRPEARARILVEFPRMESAENFRDVISLVIADAEEAVDSLGDEDQGQYLLASLAAAVARTGDSEHAEALARRVTLSSVRALAMAAVAHEIARNGNRDLTIRLADSAERLARSVIDPNDHAKALTRLIRALTGSPEAGAQDLLAECVSELTRCTTRTGEGHSASTEAVWVVTEAGYLDEAEAIARSGPDDVWTLMAAVSGFGHAGNDERARVLAAEVISKLRLIQDIEARDNASLRFAETLAEIGFHEQAKMLLEEILLYFHRDRVRTIKAIIEVSRGDLARASKLVSKAAAKLRPDQSHELATLVEVAARAGDLKQAKKLARLMDDPEEGTKALVQAARAIAKQGDSAGARVLSKAANRLACSITDEEEQAEALVAAVGLTAEYGHYDKAEAMASMIYWPEDQARALAAACLAAGKVNDKDRAVTLATKVEALATSVGEPQWQAIISASMAPALPVQSARRLVAYALRWGPWTTALEEMGTAEPEVAVSIARKYLAMSRSR